MLIEVTQEDIDNGEKVQADRCAVAIALQRCGFINAHISQSNIVYGVPYKSIETPFAASEFIKHYDANDEVKPFSFELDID